MWSMLTMKTETAGLLRLRGKAIIMSSLRLLLLLLCCSQLSSSRRLYPDTHFQNIHPGCNISLLPNTVCSSSQYEDVGHTFEEITLDETDFVNCSSSPDGSHQVYYVLEGVIKLDLSTDKSLDMDSCDDGQVTCYCSLMLQAPPGWFITLRGRILRSSRTPPVSKDVEALFTNDTTLDVARVNWNSVLEFKGSSTSNKQTIYINRSDVGATELVIEFEALPECARQLHITCFSQMTGFIQTFWWEYGQLYPFGSEDCVTLYVPDEHVTMISLVNLDINQDGNGQCLDTLTFYTSESCKGEPLATICRAHEFSPSVFGQAMSFRFSRRPSALVSTTGFRLFYSYHNKSAVPRQLPNKTWDCSVPYYDDFQLHFVCSLQTFCSDGRDKTECPRTGLCGVYHEGRCYRPFFPRLDVSWNEASDICRNYGGHLASLNTAEEWHSFREMIQDSSVEVFVGLQFASAWLPNIYKRSWIWVDGTIAIYANVSWEPTLSPFCAVFPRGSGQLTIITCYKNIHAHFACEIDSKSTSEAGNTTNISLPIPSNWTRKLMIKCHHNHMTHQFFACDVSNRCNVFDQEDVAACSSNISNAGPYFWCRNQVQLLPYSLVCDFRSDCYDGSDEDFCQFPSCEFTQHICADKKQCITRNQICDGRYDCVDESDETECMPGGMQTNDIPPPAIVDFRGDGIITVTPLNSSSLCPQTHFQCPDEGYCLPVYVRCNGANDCPGHEDEADCEIYTCPGFYRCRVSRICVHQDHLCDNVFQCPQRDDELMCGFTCPKNCTCYGHAFICSGVFPAVQYPNLRYLDAGGTAMKPEDFTNNSLLVHLSLKNCGITAIGDLDYPNLQSLDLSYNKITELSSASLTKLGNLRRLALASNSLLSLDALVFTDAQFPMVTEVDFSGVDIQELNETFLTTFPNVREVNLSDTDLQRVSKLGFQNLKDLRMLDLSGCDFETFYPGVFSGLDKLKTVYTENYKLCCPENLPPGLSLENCHSPMDEISSCEALLRSEVFRVFLGIYAVLALTGNLGSFVYRVFVEKSARKMGYEIFVTHLCVADFLMGVYLAIIGIADRVYYGDYQWNDTAWKHSIACKVAGFLSLVSSEMSAFLMCLITFERFLVMAFPLKNLCFGRLSAHAVSTLLWVVGLLLAMVPLLPMTSHWEFYSQSGICIPLPVTRKHFDGSDYAFGVMIVFNFVQFLLIAVGQVLICWSIRANSFASKDSNSKFKDMTIARRLLAVVMTDFICWFPIGLVGILARIGFPISSDVNVAMAIFVLPFNSALNPFLYTFNMLMERRRGSGREGQPKNKGTKVRSSRYAVKNTSVEIYGGQPTGSYKKEEAFDLFCKFLNDGLLTPEQVRHQVWGIFEGKD